MLLALLSVFAIISIMPNHVSVHEELQPYVDDVAVLSEGNLKGFTHIGLSDFVEDGVLGYCFKPKTKALRYISINKKLWKDLLYHDRIMLIAHEISHCLRDAEHVDGYRGFCPINFMNSYDGGSWCNKELFDMYVEQMKVVGKE